MKQDISKNIKPGRIVVPDSLGVSESLQHWIRLHNLVFQGHLEINYHDCKTILVITV